jgi:hypothetical protein
MEVTFFCDMKPFSFFPHSRCGWGRLLEIVLQSPASGTLFSNLLRGINDVIGLKKQLR